MPFYKSLDSEKPEDRRIAEKLLTLREALDQEIPAKLVDTKMILATWNIREFGGSKYGGRDRESLFYLAEILSRFDLIAVQEVRDDLDALDDLMQILGGWWKYLLSDACLGASGNRERLTYIYDSRKLTFGGLAGELVPALSKVGDKLVAEFGFARTPYLAGFRAGWFKFTICTQHLYYGKATADDPQRLEEAKTVVRLLKERMKSKDAWAYNAILLGDWNVFSTEDETFKTLESGGFRVPQNLRGKYTNAKLDKPYDQMAFIAPAMDRQLTVAKGGVFDFYGHVYRDDEAGLYPQVPEGIKFSEWRTYQMSDHLPVWVELGVDMGADYLRRKAQPPA
jgi:endonuclease/exonuclease/phosphatase family metal-dependent hydrolase